jgi:hypothetical protein
MRKFIFVLMTLMATLSCFEYARACGDKTMRVKTGLRFQFKAWATKHPTSILIHSAALPPGKAVELGKFLNGFGQKAQAVDNIDNLSNDLRTGNYDLVLTTLDAAPNLQKQAESFAPKTIVVPVLFKRAKAEEVAASRQYKGIVKNPTNGDDFLTAIYRTMTSRPKKA